MCLTYRALCEIKQGGDKIIIATVVVVSGWTTGGGSSCSSLWLLLAISLLFCCRLTSVWSQSIVLHHFWTSRILCLRLLCLVLQKAWSTRCELVIYYAQKMCHQCITPSALKKLTSRKKLMRYGSCFSLAQTIQRNWISSFSVGAARTSPHSRISF